MTNLQKVTLRASEIRGRLSELGGINDQTDETRSEIESLRNEYKDVEIRSQALIVAGDEPVVTETREDKKLSELEGQCSVSNFLMEAVTDKRMDGPDLEYRQEILGSNADTGLMPINLLADTPLETRAVTPVADSATGLGSQAPILARVFERSLPNFLNFNMPSVPMGTRTYPYMTGGTTVSMQEKSGSQAAVAGTFAGETLEPKRLTGAYEFRVEDLELLAGLENALRRDLRSTLQDKMNEQILRGNGTSPNVSGFLDELPAPTAEGARATWNSYIDAATGLVDGLNAYNASDIAMVWNTQTYSHAESVYRSNQSEESAYIGLTRNRGVRVQVSNRMPAAPTSGSSNKNSTILAALTSYPGGSAVAPIWNHVRIIKDEFSLALHGEVRIVMLMLWNFKIVRQDGWKLIARQTQP